METPRFRFRSVSPETPGGESNIRESPYPMEQGRKGMG